MTNEQREAIEYIEQFIGKEKEYKYKPIKVKTLPNTKQAIDTVLSLIKEQQEKIDKKDKIINEMIEEYEYNDGINTKKFCDEEIRKDKCIENCTICMQQYFADLVEKE